MNRISPALDQLARRFALPLLPLRISGAWRTIALLACILVPPCACATSAHPADSSDADGEGWVATWGAAPVLAPAGLAAFDNQTLRLIVHTSVGGNRVRIRLSNAYASMPLTVGAARIAVRTAGADIAPGTDRALPFGGRGAIVIPAGATLLSDPVELNVPALADLAVSLYLPGTVKAPSVHAGTPQINYVSPPGDFSAAATLPVQRTIGYWPILAGVDVDGRGPAIVVLDDALSDSADSSGRWPDWLARRLQTERLPQLAAHGRPGLVKLGNSGNRLVGTRVAEAARPLLDRFDAVLATSGVRYLILMSGREDIDNRLAGAPLRAEQLIAAYRQLTARARARGLAVFGATLTPFEGAKVFTSEKEALRQALNDWVRASDAFDGVIDFDLALRDPARPARLLPAYDSGDHLHPNDFGHELMGNTVPLTLFSAPGPVAH